MKEISNTLWGLLLVIIGVIFGLNALDVTDIDIFFDGWWTLFIIVPCFIGLFSEKEKTGNLVGIVIGLFLLLACQDIINFEFIWKLIVPFIIVVVGLNLIFKDMFFKSETNKIEKNKDKKKLREYCATFSEQKINYEEEFQGGEFTAIFGGIEYDLRNAIIKEDIVINTTCIFGGIDLYLPKDVNVKVSSTPIFGGVDNKRYKSNKDSKVTIYVNATCIFGGVDIK